MNGSIRFLAILLILLGSWLIADTITSKVSGDAIAMAIGFLFGILGVFPIAILLISMTSRQNSRDKERESQKFQQSGANPPHIIVLGGSQLAPPFQQTQALPQQQQYLPLPSQTQGRPRRQVIVDGDESAGEFRIIGDEGQAW